MSEVSNEDHPSKIDDTENLDEDDAYEIYDTYHTKAYHEDNMDHNNNHNNNICRKGGIWLGGLGLLRSR